MNTSIDYLKACCQKLEFKKALVLLESYNLDFDFYLDSNLWFEIVSIYLRVVDEVDLPIKKEYVFASISRLSEAQKDNSDILYLNGRIQIENQNINLAQNYFQRAFDLAKTSKQKFNALLGLSIVCFFKAEYDKSLKTLDGISKQILAQLEPEFEIALSLWLTQIYFAQKNSALALEFLEHAKKISQTHRNYYLLLKSFIIEIEIRNFQCRYEDSFRLVNMAQVFLSPNDNIKIERQLMRLQAQIFEMNSNKGFDFILSESQTILKCPNGQIIEFTKFPQLTELLKKLISLRGQILSKEEICLMLWGREYHPLEVDNKIYVTIKRLRSLMQDDTKSPKYVLQKDIGYCINVDNRFTLVQHRKFDLDENNL